MKKYLKWFLWVSLFIGIFSALGSIMAIEEPLETRLIDDMLISEANAVKLKNILSEVGITDYHTIIHDELLDNAHGLNEKGYRINTNEVKNVILYATEDFSFVKVKYANEVLFNDGKSSGKLASMILTDDQKADLKINTIEAVKQVLTFPDTAKFPLIDGWKYGIIEGESVVQGFVESENAFGQTLKVEFQAKYKANALTSLIVGDTEYIKK